MKETSGVFGISFLIKSAKYSPVVLQARILEFIDIFFAEQFDEQLFEDFRGGLLSQRKQGYINFLDESDDWFKILRTSSLDKDRGVDWSLREA